VSPVAVKMLKGSSLLCTIQGISKVAIWCFLLQMLLETENQWFKIRVDRSTGILLAHIICKHL